MYPWKQKAYNRTSDTGTHEYHTNTGPPTHRAGGKMVQKGTKTVYAYGHYNYIRASSSEFVSSSIPSWQILTAHTQPFRGARDLVFCLKVPLDSLLVWASSEGSGETARMRRLAWTFAARIGDKFQIPLTRSIHRQQIAQLSRCSFIAGLDSSRHINTMFMHRVTLALA